jgi:hypothetical protein
MATNQEEHSRLPWPIFGAEELPTTHRRLKKRKNPNLDLPSEELMNENWIHGRDSANEKGI